MAIVMILVMMFSIMAFASRYVKVPPNKAMVVFGARTRDGSGMKIYTSGGKFILPIIESWSWLDLCITTLDLTIREIQTDDRKSIDIEVVVQAQIDPTEDTLKTAAVMLLKKSAEEVEYVVKNTIEGHVRGVCITLTLDQIRADRCMVSEEIHAVAVKDLRNMGLNIVSLTIRDAKESGAMMSDSEREEVMKDLPERVVILERELEGLKQLLGVSPMDPAGSSQPVTSANIHPETTSSTPPHPPPHPPPPAPTPQPSASGSSCPACHQPMVFMGKYQRWFCRTCKAWR